MNDTDTRAATVGDTGEVALPREALGARIETEDHVDRGWFTRLVGAYLRKRRQAHVGADAAPAGSTQSEAARRAIRVACIKSTATGALSGTIATAATVLTAETKGVAALVAVPVAAGAVGGEMVLRAMIHIDLTLELADLFEVRFDLDDPRDLWRLYSVAFKTQAHEDDEDPGRDLVHRVMHVDGEEVGERIGAKLVGESIMRNVVPFVGIASSSLTNWIKTKRLGDTVRRYMRYRRALDDAIAQVERECSPFFELLVEGVWFLFIADGRLNPEETAVLANLLRRCDPATRADVERRLVVDELEWLQRLERIPDGMREPFLHALEVAAAVDKSISLPERKLLRLAARALGQPFDAARLDAMMKTFEDIGVLDGSSKSAPR